MNRIMLGISVVSLIFVAGCSHNLSTYSDGIGLETTFRPDSGNFGITLRYGKIWSLVVRENTEAEMTGGAELAVQQNYAKNINESEAFPATENCQPSTVNSALGADMPIALKTDAKVWIKIGRQHNGFERDIIELLKDNPEALKAFFESK